MESIISSGSNDGSEFVVAQVPLVAPAEQRLTVSAGDQGTSSDWETWLDFVAPSAAAAEERSERASERASRAPQVAADPASFAEGGCLSNTHPHDSQVRLEGYTEYLISGGFDWLAWSACVTWEPHAFDRLFQELEARKATCQQEKKAAEWMDLNGTEPVCVYRTGVNIGGDKGQHFEFKIGYKGITIGLAKQQQAVKKRPNLFVCLAGRECLLHGAREAYASVLRFMALLGGQVGWEKISRADLCLDICGLDVGILQGAVEQQQFVSLARSVKPHRELVEDRRTGFEAGKRPLHLTVYDKAHELRSKCDGLYREAMIERRWGGEMPRYATRVEFQISRPWLVKHGISSPCDLFQLAGTLASTLSQDWFRLTDSVVDRKNNNQSRVETLPLWEMIQQGFSRIFGQPSGELAPVDREKIDTIRLVKQGRGCLSNAVLQRGQKCTTYNDLILEMAKLLHDVELSQADRERYMVEFNRRATGFAA